MSLCFNRNNPSIVSVIRKDVHFYQLQCKSQYSKSEFLHPELILSANCGTDVKCMEWHPSKEECNIIALGQMNGCVTLKSVSTLKTSESSVLSGKDFVSKNQKQCNALAWNEVSSNWLAVGLDRHPRHASLLIWDVHSKCSSDALVPGLDRGKVGADQPAVQNSAAAITKPLVEYGIAESVNSMMWTPGTHNKLLLAGMSKKCLRLYDVRIPTVSQPSVINHKATMGLCANPFYDHRIASFYDDIVVIWDLRKLTKPTFALNAPQKVCKIEWNPARSGLLAVSYGSARENSQEGVESASLCVYDVVMNVPADIEVGQPVKYNVTTDFPDGDGVNGFAWHPNVNNCILAVSNSESFKMLRVKERTSVSWRGYKSFGVVCEKEMYSTVDQKEKAPSMVDDEFIDVEEIVRRRSQTSYGIKEDVTSNIELCLEPENIHLKLMWKWMGVCQSLEKLSSAEMQVSTPKSPANRMSSKNAAKRKDSGKSAGKNFYGGAKNVLRDNPIPLQSDVSGEPGNVGSSTAQINWIGVANMKSTIYKSKSRDWILAMCGWTNLQATDVVNKLYEERFGKKGLGEELVQKLLQCGEAERACAIALWHLDIKLAINSLNSTPSSQPQRERDDASKLRAVAMAMSGYTGTSSPTLWIETCVQMQASLKSPYLQMAFSFLLTCADEKKADDEHIGRYESILNNRNILLQDRVAFACLYLPDILLDNYLKTLTDHVISEALLDGLLITGINTAMGIQLLQNYVDKTCDVQTALCVLLQTRDRTFLNSSDVLFWKDSYTNLLNKWGFYVERVLFDLEWMKMSGKTKSSSQVYVYCNYCNKSISNQGRSGDASPRRGLARTHSYSGCTRSTPKKNSQMSILQKCAALFSPVQRFGGLLGSQAPDEGSARISPKDAASIGRGRGFMGGNLAMQSPITTCPSCRKPLPRCSVCSMHLGTRPKEPEYKNWISWCLKCRHGGHQGHLEDWFQEFKQCPVSDCKCFCNSAPISDAKTIT